jgi:hypothetical protein
LASPAVSCSDSSCKAGGLDVLRGCLRPFPVPKLSRRSTAWATDHRGPFLDRGRLGRGVGGVQGRRRRSRSDGSVRGLGVPAQVRPGRHAHRVRRSADIGGGPTYHPGRLHLRCADCCGCVSWWRPLRPEAMTPRLGPGHRHWSALVLASVGGAVRGCAARSSRSWSLTGRASGPVPSAVSEPRLASELRLGEVCPGPAVLNSDGPRWSCPRGFSASVLT